MSIETDVMNSLLFTGEADNRYAQLVHSLPAAIYTCDADGYIKIFNKAAVDLWGREPEAGKELWCGSWKIYNTDGSPMPLDSCPMAIALKEKRPVYGAEIVVERPDGTRRNVLPHPRPIFNAQGEVIEAVNMLVDVTEQRRRDKNEKNKLEKLVQKRTKELEKINFELERSNDDLEQYAYVASHDLQEPLRKIQTFANLIQARYGTALEQEAKSGLDKIISAAGRMTRLINDLLSYSRLNDKGKVFVQTDLNDIFNKVLTDFEIAIKQKNATIHNSGLPIIDAIPLQISQLFHNLLGNSLKFSGDSLPVIKIWSELLFQEALIRYPKLDPNKQYIKITFRDNGIGFDPEFSEQIFNLFSRLNGRSTTEGSGIGLALCRKIVSNHCGIMNAESRENEGASFHIILPIHQSTGSVSK